MYHIRLRLRRHGAFHAKIPLMTLPRIASIHAGKVAPLGPDRVPSGFVKQSLDQPVRITPLGVTGDEQADLSVHGGPDKAVYGYSFELYSLWRMEYPRHAALLMPGGFGENLCIEGMRETDICVGDVHRIGGARLQVCQPRQPCFKLALRFADKMMPKAMVRSGRAGGITGLWRRVKFHAVTRCNWRSASIRNFHSHASWNSSLAGTRPPTSCS